ncbi:MAG: LysM peptidoglycan-binding domain-containing protein [Candidatus Acidiferrum sp.]
MMLTDLYGPLPLQPRRPGSGRISLSSTVSVSLAAFLCCVSFGAAVSCAQDQQTQSVADAARQARARKNEKQKPSAHVYTNDDLSRAHILTSEDRAVAEAKRNECAQKKNCSPASPQNPPASLDANSGTNGTSLGEVARQYRKQKDLQALKPKQSAPFHLPFPAPALASPVLPERPAIRPPIQPVVHQKISSQVFLRDPFSSAPVRPHIPAGARHGIQPSAENVRPSTRPEVREKVRSEVRNEVRTTVQPEVRPDFNKIVRPNVRPRPRLIVPAQPNVFARPVAPSFAFHPQPASLAPVAQPVAPAATVRPLQPAHALPSAIVPSQTTVSVRPGDSLWKLALVNLGHGSRWHELLAANRWIADPDHILPGARLSLPVVSARAAVTTRVASPSSNSSASSIKVHRGDTLWSLARTKLGHSAVWPCLAAANPGIHDPNRIYEGQLLLLPTTCSTQASSSAALPVL